MDEYAIELEAERNLGALGQTERLDRGQKLGQNPAEYVMKEQTAEGDGHAVGSHASTASTGGAGEKTQKRTEDRKELPDGKKQLSTINVSETSKPIL